MTCSHKKRWIDKDLSWLEFNSRVLSMGMDPSTPILERLKFIGIVSSNFDEFFMLRIAALMDAKGSPHIVILKKIRELINKKNLYFQTVMIPELAKEGVFRVEPQALSEVQREFLKDYFHRELFPILTPIGLLEDKPFPTLSNLGVYAVISLVKSGGGTEKYAVIELPRGISRYCSIPSDKKSSFVLIEDVIGMFAQELFVDCRIENQGLIRLTRVGEMALEEETDFDFATVVAHALQVRKQAKIVRLESSLSDSVLSFFKKKLGLSNEGIYKMSTWFDFKSLAPSLYSLDLPRLKYVHRIPQLFASSGNSGKWWKYLKSKDICLHHPYDSFDSVVEFLNAAAKDPNVLAIKQTLYRTGHESRVVAALEQAAKNGKQVVVIVELKARFDEEKNIQWARQLEMAGATIFYGVIGLKVHAKVCLVVRRELEQIKQYVHLSTGNYNEKTSQIYSDLGFLTSNTSITTDISLFFNMITGYAEPAQLAKLIISPHGLRNKLCELIKREITKGKQGYIMVKINSLADQELIELLYQASNAGCQIKLNVRGICCLRPGVPGMSENIEVVSVVGKFLEHSRIFYFANGGDGEVYLSSADWRSRNLDNRVEIMFPIENKRTKKYLINLLKLYFKDNVNSWRLTPSGKYQKVKSSGSLKFQIQEFLCEDALIRGSPKTKGQHIGVIKPRFSKRSIL